MEITRITRLDLIGFDVSGAADTPIALRFAKITYHDAVVVSRELHRTMISPGDDIDALMVAVNEDLVQRQGFAAVPDRDIETIKVVAADRWREGSAPLV